MRSFTRLTVENGYYVGKEVVIQVTKNDLYVSFYDFQRFVCHRFL